MTSDDEFRSWRDDLAADEANALLMRTLAAAAAEEIDRPHIVVCTDPETGATSYSGPYPDGLAALAAAERDDERERSAGLPERMRYSVATLREVEGTADV